MRIRHYLVVIALSLIVLSSAAAGAGVDRSSVQEARPFAASLSAAQADKRKDAPPADDAPPTRDQILKEGPVALEQNCTQCHQSDKWEGTNRDHDGWAAIVREMSRQMVEAGTPPMSERTTNLIIDYLTLTRPQ